MTKPDKELETQLESLRVLGDPVRRALYFHVLGQEGEVSREQAARALHLSRALAAFHMDKLVDAGLLQASYRRLSGRKGPGAGRPSKLYSRAAGQIDVTLPARRYELAARLLAGAMNEAGPAAATALERVAEAWGRQMGLKAREQAGGRTERGRLLRSAVMALRAAGFEPRTDAAGQILLGNCPFDALANEARTMICGMNLALCRGLAAGLGSGLAPRLEPGPDRCCVVFEAGRAAAG